MTVDIYKNLRVSIIRFIKDQIADLNSTYGRGVEYYDFGNHADNQEIPDGDLIGLTSFGVTNDTNDHEVVFGIGLSTWQDAGSFNLADYVSSFYDQMQNGMIFPIYDHSDASQIGTASFQAGTTCSIMARVEIRPFVQVSANVRVSFRKVP